MIGVLKIRRRISWREVGVSEFAEDFFCTLWNLVCIAVDVLMFVAPRWRRRQGIAFLVHPPNEYHIFTPLPLLRYTSPMFVRWLVKYLPPYRLGKLTVCRPYGVKVLGRLFTITVAPEHLQWPDRSRVSREMAVRQVRHQVRLAERWGTELIGLGAYLPAITRQGKVLLPEAKALGVGLTTGHACTVAVIRKYLYDLASNLDIDLGSEVVAIVGAAGSTGSAVARVLAYEGKVKHLLLIDLPTKLRALESVAKECGGEISISLAALPKASVIVTLTTSPGSIINLEHLGPSVLIIDDSKPRNTSPEILREAIQAGQALVVDVLAEVPNLKTTFHYDLDLSRQAVTYTCLAEVLALAVAGWQGNYSIGDVTLSQVQEMDKFLGLAGIKPASLTGFGSSISMESLERFRSHRSGGKEFRAVVSL